MLVQTAQVATNLSQALIAVLPTNRDINAALLLAPSVHATGPNGSYSISGGMTFENLFLLNGVTINENLRGQPHDLYIEDAIQETIVASAGVSAEFGRFGGGVVNVITKSGGNHFSGSLRDTLNNDNWRALTPLRRRHHSQGPAADLRIHARRTDHAQSPLVFHRRTAAEHGGRAHAGDDQRRLRFHQRAEALRGQGAPIR